MNYVELLRVRNALRVVAIVLGVLLALGVVCRLWLGVEYGFDPATGTISHATASQGPVHAMHGGIVITTTTGATTKDSHVGSIGTIAMDTLLSFAYVAGLVIATAFGGSFSRERDHLEFAALKPVSRERFAFGTIGADIAGIYLAEALTAIAAVLGVVLFGGTHFDFHNVSAGFIGLIVVMPVAWYLFLNAITASLKRGAGMIVGFSWPVSAIVIALGDAQLGISPLGLSVHAIFWTVSRILPLTYTSISSSLQDRSVPLHGGVDLLAGFILVLVYGALTLVQWRRVEA